MTLWDGHMQIPEKDNVALECFTTLGNLLVIADKHPNIDDITANITEVKACTIDENKKCIRPVKVLIRKCNGNLLYRFPSFNITNVQNEYICFDKIYSGTPCKDAISIEHNENPSKYGNILKFTPSVGWTDTSVRWKQYAWPSLADKNIIFDECSVARESNWYIFSQEPLPSDIGEEAKRIVVCYVSKLFGYYNVIYDGKGNCHYYAYVRSCNGNLQYDLSAASYYLREVCFIHYNNVKVHPRIVHEENTIVEEGKEIAMYTSSLQYRCSFDVMENTQYIANWYINGSFRVQMGPSSDLDDLVFKDNYLTTLKHGYEVICGIFPAAENESTEAVSDAYYAGWKIQNENIILSKSGDATVTIEQTIPLGCSYREDDAANCLETLTFEDIVNKADDCSGGIEVKSFDDPSKPFIEIQKLRKGEVWAKKEFRALLSSLDNNYDDWTDFDLLLLLTNNSSGYIGESSPQVHIVGAVHVSATINDI
ncbi:uncharacterized protein LOC132742245 [Ruditapes philippinarum]|uniref:uncharacterized protein LOC132742245 n=1 Tax=Ruditapes philippinarum TaxID=129788 RepID=UPI00295A5B7E|nr:uncharacterized protein LOC132742245 [Ruditapes philippinarum]